MDSKVVKIWALTTFFLLVSCTDEEPVESVSAVKPAKLITVAVASNRRALDFPAVVRAVDYAELTFQITGEIRELNVLEGDEVEEGAIIAQLDQRDSSNELTRIRAEYQNAEAEYRRAERLITENAISISTVESRKTSLDIAAAQLSIAEKALEDTILRAPFSGQISRIDARQFQNIQAKEPIAVIQSERVEAIVNVPGTIIARIPQLEPVNSIVILDAAPNLEIPATYREATGVADENTQTYEISFTFDPPSDLLILPGMTASLITTFIFKDAKDILPDGVSVPLEAVFSEENETFVWVVNPLNMNITKRPVEVDLGADENLTVISGLEDGETIIAAGVSFFHEGMRVSAWQPE